MQGRITKVLNMKPPEILGLLEEAAGTKMYETKKQVALRTMEKKQTKVDEINKILEEDIMPALDKLRNEKTSFMEWQNATAKVDRLKRFCVAYNYVEAQKLLSTGESEIQQTDKRIADMDAELSALQAEIIAKSDEVTALQTEKELQTGGEVKELMKKVDDLSKQLVKDTSGWSNKKDLLQAEQASRDSLVKQLADLGEEELAARVAAAETGRAEAQGALDAAVANVTSAEAELAGAEAGDGRDGSNRSLQERLADAQNAQTEAEAEAKSAETKVKHLTKQLAEQRKTLATKEKEGGKLSSQVETERTAVDACKQRLSSCSFDPSAAESSERTADEARAAVRTARDRVDELSSQLASINFQYKDPEKGFDRGRVKGVVAKLIRVTDPKSATALEVAAGGKLYQVVVDTEATGKSLLKNGGLRNRVTIIPLNKVSSRPISDQVAFAARKLVGDKAQPALELVGYDGELEAAMKYAFGGSFICNDAGTAKKLAFAKEVSTRCITLDGDDFNPGGTLTGGSRAKGGSLLMKVHKLAQAEEQLEREEAVLAQTEAVLKSMSQAKKEYAKLSQELELKQHALSLIEERLAGSEAAQAAAAVKWTENNLQAAQDAVTAAQEKKVAMVAQAKELAAEIASFSTDKDKRVKGAKDKLKASKASVEDAKKAVKEAAATLQAAQAEQEAAEGERTSIAEQIQTADAAVAGLESAVDQLATVVSTAKQQYKDASASLEERKARLKECDHEIRIASKEKSELEEKSQILAVERKKEGNKLDSMRRGIGDAAERCRAMEREHSWIPTEAAHFGKEGGDYDWTNNSPADMFSEYKDASEKIDKLGKKVNKKVMAMFEKAEEEYGELKRKRDVVEGDKSKIQEVMDGLDEKKKEALEATWRKVNADFGSIFSTLLPGTSARLEPPESGTFLDGLEVKVAFGGVWKQSLSELSGGQKSLLALSLILAMLLFKPAPIYILDEVDAALDLSHTQNIGRMIKSHFPQSQFIVVSLKEGMFNNANVIFRTKFVDGVSTVTRNVNERSGGEEQRGGGGGGGGKQLSARGRGPLKENVRA
jgi:structural maintenance of chromosome 2